MSAVSDTPNQKKRKRTKNTSVEQYELYIQFMENDYAFRSETINPSMEVNYLENKWKSLVDQLNAIPDGPIMNVQEWQKRFLDWKYATRAKYRKIKEHRMKTGSGPQLDKTISKLEERALAIWGTVVVTGNEDVTHYEGINIQEQELPFVQPPVSPVIELDNFNSNLELPIPIIIDSNNDIPEINENNLNVTNKPKTNKKRTLTHKRICSDRQKPLSLIGERLLEATENNSENIKSLNEILKDSASKYFTIEEKKLKFQIAKYRHENPNFEFDFD